GDVAGCEAGEDGDQYPGHDPGADLGIGNAAEERGHRDSGIKLSGRRAALGASLAGIKARPLGKSTQQGMAMALKKLVAGNWKMHGLSSDLDEVKVIAAASRDFPQVDVALCVPAILIERAARAVPGFSIGGQDVH